MPHRGEIIMWSIVTILCVAMLGTYIAKQPIYDECKYLVEEYDMYYTDAPFGIYWIEADASMGGFLIFITGRSDAELQLSYTTQYFVGKELHTEIFDADDINVVFDGTFRMIKISRYATYYNRMGETWNGTLRFRRYRIHLPVENPPVNRTITFIK
jgi:hypothetical protein